MATATKHPTETPVIDDDHKAVLDERYGYHVYEIGRFKFERDEYFVRVSYPKGTYIADVGNFLRSMMRDVAWGFFYGWVNFDDIFGTVNRYGSVDVFVGTYNAGYKTAGTDFVERFDAAKLLACFKSLLSDWTNEGYDPFAAPLETGTPYGSKNGNNDEAVNFQRELAERFVGLPGDTEIRTDERGFPVNRHFRDVLQDAPEVHAEPGFEGQLSAFSLFDYLARSPVTWNPSIVSCVGESAYCPTSEEHILPIQHGNDRVEWVYPVVRPDHLGSRRQGDRGTARCGNHESRRRLCDARRHSASRLFAETLDAPGVGKHGARPRRALYLRRTAADRG